MNKKPKLTAAQTQALYDDYLQGLSRKAILKKHGVTIGQYKYWTDKLSGKYNENEANNYDNIQIIQGKKARKCGKCNKEFQPYTIRFAECYYLCPFCYLKGQQEYDAENFDEMEC